jgi:hypothetical protein
LNADAGEKEEGAVEVAEEEEWEARGSAGKGSILFVQKLECIRIFKSSEEEQNHRRSRRTEGAAGAVSAGH